MFYFLLFIILYFFCLIHIIHNYFYFLTYYIWKLFNELYKVRSEIDEKDELLSEKNQHINLLTNNINMILGQNETMEYLQTNNLLVEDDFNEGWTSIRNIIDPKKNNQSSNKKKRIRIHDKNKITFFDKNTIRPLRGGFKK